MKRPIRRVLLLLALLLPLQGYAFAASCEFAGTAAHTQHCANHPDMPATGTHHACGACCCMAVSTAPPLVLTGRVLSTAASPRPPLAAHPTLLRDRLDRPPRD